MPSASQIAALAPWWSACACVTACALMSRPATAPRIRLRAWRVAASTITSPITYTLMAFRGLPGTCSRPSAIGFIGAADYDARPDVAGHRLPDPAPPGRRPPRPRPRDHARGERRPGRLGARARGLPEDRPRGDRRAAGRARRGEVDAHRRADEAAPGAGPQRRGPLDRPVVAVHPGRAARRPHQV